MILTDGGERTKREKDIINRAPSPCKPSHTSDQTTLESLHFSASTCARASKASIFCSVCAFACKSARDVMCAPSDGKSDEVLWFERKKREQRGVLFSTSL